MSRARNDAATYRAMSTPHASPAACNEQARAFFDAVAELRVKHHMRDVLLVAAGSVIYEDGVEGDFTVSMGVGAQQAQTSLAAFALGECRAEDLERTNKLAAGRRAGK